MGGSGGIFGKAKQKSATEFKMSSEMTAAENEAIARQRAIASGTAPSIAQMALNHNLNQLTNQGVSMAASQRGVSNPALGMRQAMLGVQQNGLEAANQGAMMAEQERRQADDFLARQAAAQRGVALQSATANQQADMAKANGDKQMIAGIGGSMAKMLSDKNEKKNIEPTSGTGDEIEKFIDALKSYKFDYKDPNTSGKKTGIMAQDLEKTEVGKTMVDETVDGKKVVDTNKAIGVILAGMSEMNKKLNKMGK